MKRSSPLGWSKLVTLSRKRLAATLPAMGHSEHPAVDLLIDVVALSQCRFSVALIPHRVDANVSIVPSAPADPVPSDLRDQIVEFVTNRASTSDWATQLPIGKRIEDEGFQSFVIDLLKAGAEQGALMHMAEFVSEAMKALNAKIRQIGSDHLHAVLARDLPTVSQDLETLTHILVWLLATELCGDPQRPEIVTRRLQALHLFGSIAHALMEKSITAAIDGGVPSSRSWPDASACPSPKHAACAAPVSAKGCSNRTDRTSKLPSAS